MSQQHEFIENKKNCSKRIMNIFQQNESKTSQTGIKYNFQGK